MVIPPSNEKGGEAEFRHCRCFVGLAGCFSGSDSAARVEPELCANSRRSHTKYRALALTESLWSASREGKTIMWTADENSNGSWSFTLTLRSRTRMT